METSDDADEDPVLFKPYGLEDKRVFNVPYFPQVSRIERVLPPEKVQTFHQIKRVFSPEYISRLRRSRCPGQILDRSAQ